MTTSDRERMRAFYDTLGEGEWTRLESSPRGRVVCEVHRRFHERFVHRGDHVLEIGAGPGRFTFDLAHVTDFSAVQLELHRQRVGATPAEVAVLTRELLDVCDTSRYRALELTRNEAERGFLGAQVRDGVAIEE
jgi:tRNA G46 methylase TrmB